ncbi:TonB-dependent siderophore receptor [Siccirubricoccus sp. KC 17139]|uniref:TonB-dependent siderophore receptor n=1 Tax=Siccirubricoccus soli TaxID=2899147 RepID=A0ABT1D9S8_9PROT|nr:TonB-dependent siderophore receptor [Siccirubricoccus soli]MCO6417750.1 TonB-dependent siderophore receptor [Siccirubricoccus soli]MCP2683885.1 TonB-dependent siderophore receptor [Siccirubricoccus soli]
MQIAPAPGRIRLAPLLAIAFVLAAPAARAQTAQPEPEGAVRLPELRIHGARETATGPVQGISAERSASGTKTDTPLILTPQNVTVVTREQMDLQNSRNLGEALSYTASGQGLLSDFRGEYGTVRGFTPDIYLDGLRVPVPVTAHSFRIEPWGMERVELLRGANSALYGQGNLGGIINAISKAPYLGQTNEVAIQGGSFDRIQGMFDLGGAVTEDNTLLWRLNGLVRRSDTYVEGGRDNRIYLAPSLAWQPTNDTSITLLASYMRDDTGITGQWLPAFGTALPNPNGTVPRGRATGEPGWDRFHRTQFGLGARIEHRLNADWTLRSNLRYTYHEMDYTSIYGSGFSPANQQRTLARVASFQNPTYRSFAIDNTVEGHVATGPLQHTLLAGLDYRVQSLNARTYSAAAGPLDVFTPSYGFRPGVLPLTASTNQTLQQVGLYLQDQVQLDRWHLTLTGRQDFADTSNLNNRTNRETTQRDAHFTGRAALLYAFDFGLSPYFAYATSFMPAIGTFAPARGGGAFAPVTGEQFEAGIKYQPPGRSSLYSATLFQLTQQNALTADPANPIFQVQTGEIRVRGLELEARLALTPALNLIAAWTAQDPEVTRTTTGNLGMRPAAVPAHTGALWADYTYEVSEELRITLGGGVRYYGNTLGNGAPSASSPQFHVPSFTLFDAVARVDWRQWRLAVNASNLSDETFVNACYAYTSCSYGAGRAVYATLSYRW